MNEIYSIEAAESMEAIVEHILNGNGIRYEEETAKGDIYIYEDDTRAICVELWGNDILIEVK